MWNNNFWYWLLKGIGDLSSGFMSQQMPVHQAFGLVEWTATAVFYSGLFLILIVGSFFHLQALAIVVRTVLILELGRAVFAAYRWVKTVIPLP